MLAYYFAAALLFSTTLNVRRISTTYFAIDMLRVYGAASYYAPLIRFSCLSPDSFHITLRCLFACFRYYFAAAMSYYAVRAHATLLIFSSR